MSPSTARAKPSVSNKVDLTSVVYEMAAEGDDQAQMNLLFDDRFEVDVDISLLRIKDRKTGKEVFKQASMKYCDQRPDAELLAH